jgi:hypothetical protein
MKLIADPAMRTDCIRNAINLGRTLILAAALAFNLSVLPALASPSSPARFLFYLKADITSAFFP